ncbi:ATP-binding protein [Microaerobacter geothermalis]|uniref:HAMP domain-containing sensor histidine kinase n=1 Tax=Microaerobacter geothermalis TaxID=674972 RepID=UPI001F213ACC|nr:ATP-binding protein [Microaerobacter geothermalis]MCF6092527.1 ATP-binding protein [Microaerobacter geothermalis]
MKHVFGKSITTKFGLLMVSLIVVTVSAVGLVFYYLFINLYLDRLTTDLLHRGHSHAQLLSEDFTQYTLEHVAMMEKEADTSVVVFNNMGQIISQSEPIRELHSKYMNMVLETPKKSEMVLSTDWENNEYIVTKSPILHNNLFFGTVVMFSPTEPVKRTVSILKWMIISSVFGAVLVSSGFVFLLTVLITKPLIKMKYATGAIAAGHYDLQLEVKGDDEVAELGRSIQSLAKDLKHYQETRKEFLANVSHELRTPLTYLKGYAEVLGKGMIQSPEEQKKYLQIIQSESSRVQRLVQDLFELSKLEEGSFTLRKQERNITEIVRGLVEKVQPAAAKREISLKVFAPTFPLIIHVDGERMEQVLLNIIDNGMRHTSPGGKITVSLSEGDHGVEIAISDTGQGIPKNELPYIWDRLYRVEKSRARDLGGSGLGLSICKQIVELHEGEINVESEEGKGTTFFIWLPKIKKEGDKS